MVWLTVVTTFGMIGTITTGYFGMNILSADVFGAGEPAFLYKLLFFVGVLAARSCCSSSPLRGRNGCRISSIRYPTIACR